MIVTMAKRRKRVPPAHLRGSVRSRLTFITSELRAAGVARPAGGAQPPDYNRLRKLRGDLRWLVRYLGSDTETQDLALEARGLGRVVDGVLASEVVRFSPSHYPEISDVSVRSLSGGLPEMGRR
jgi:hypothetical protein